MGEKITVVAAEIGGHRYDADAGLTAGPGISISGIFPRQAISATGGSSGGGWSSIATVDNISQHVLTQAVVVAPGGTINMTSSDGIRINAGTSPGQHVFIGAVNGISLYSSSNVTLQATSNVVIETGNVSGDNFTVETYRVLLSANAGSTLKMDSFGLQASVGGNLALDLIARKNFHISAYGHHVTVAPGGINVVAYGNTVAVRSGGITLALGSSVTQHVVVTNLPSTSPGANMMWRSSSGQLMLG